MGVAIMAAKTRSTGTAGETAGTATAGTPTADTKRSSYKYYNQRFLCIS